MILVIRAILALVFLASCFLVITDVLDHNHNHHSVTVSFVRSTRLTAEGEKALESVVMEMKRNPRLAIRVIGHTAPDGDEMANLDLSRRRAHVVADALVAAGLDPETLLEVDGRGGKNPPEQENGESESTWKRRAARVELLISREPVE